MFSVQLSWCGEALSVPSYCRLCLNRVICWMFLPLILWKYPTHEANDAEKRKVKVNFLILSNKVKFLHFLKGGMF
jgi:hypothetical protein